MSYFQIRLFDKEYVVGKKITEMPKLQIPDADKKLKDICQKGMKEIFGKNPPEAVKARLSHELKVVSKNKHSAYYLLASMFAKEAERIHHAVFFRGTITGSLIAYTSGISKINPMEKEFGGVDLPFEVTREEYECTEPTLDMQCSMAFIFFAQSFLARELPEYRCVTYPLNSSRGIKSVRIYFIKDDELPLEDPVDIEGSRLDEYPEFMFFDEYFHITMIGQDKLELVRYNTFYREGIGFDEADSEKIIPKLWKYIKNNDDSISGYKKLKVRSYEELITVLGMAHSTDVWGGVPKKMVLDGELPLSRMIGTRDDLFSYFISLGIENKEAYTIMNRVRKGKGLSQEDEEELRKNGAEEWVIALCMQARYIFPRAHIAQMIRRDAFCLYGAEEVSPSDCGHCVLQDSFIG